MSKQGINRVTLLGNLGHDPESKTLENGNVIAKIQLATSESWEQSGERVTQVEWHTVIFFNGLAQVVQEYLKKGSKIYVEGKLKTNHWQDDDGVKHSRTDVIAREMQMLGDASRSLGAGVTTNISNTKRSGQSQHVGEHHLEKMKAVLQAR